MMDLLFCLVWVFFNILRAVPKINITPEHIYKGSKRSISTHKSLIECTDEDQNRVTLRDYANLDMGKAYE